ncbi:MAG: hypothetical protein H5T86_01585 [Armatimonadetes bacterium]|nr:hypothetical protein [Armatimonadota bacterium]
MSRWIGFISVPGFYALAHEQQDQGLRERPFAVVKNGKVIDISRAAEAAGASRNVRLAELRWLCPEAVTVEYEESLYHGLYRRLWDTVYSFAPLVEPRAWHAGFFDATGCLHGEVPMQWRGRLAKAVANAIGLSAYIGMAPTRPLAQMAARAGQCVAAEEVTDFLTAAPIRWLPMPAEVVEELQRLGIRHVAEIRNVSQVLLCARFGKLARELLEIASGGGPWGVEAAYPPPCVEGEIGPVENADAIALRCLLRELCGELFAELERRGAVPKLVRLRIELMEGPAAEAEHAFAKPPESPGAVEQAVWKMWQELWDGRDLATARVVLDELVCTPPQQYDLVGDRHRAASRQARLRQAMRIIARRFGAHAVMLASNLPPRMRLAERIVAMQMAD